MYCFCRYLEFECSKSKQCIPRSFVNNGKIDCAVMLIHDDSDENQVLPHCLPSEFPCNYNETLRCIPREWVGDGHKDCHSAIDEKINLAFCHNLTEFQCQSKGRCIPRHRVMDQFPDCPNATDELSSLICFAHSEFQCRDNGRCIPRSWRGNKLVNCLDGSDETPMLSNETCVGSEFRCHNNKRCIPMSLVCDEIESCEEPRMFRCPTNVSKCTHWEHSCDTIRDCPDNADDITSIYGFKCKKNFVAGAQTTSRHCFIPQWALNDSYGNCDDESDFCFVNETYKCTVCLNNKTTIATRQICDGVLDCPDFSDECLCSRKVAAANRSREFCDNICYGNQNIDCNRCRPGQLWCSTDNTCVNAEKVCDQKIDCPLSQLDETLCSAPEEAKIALKKYDFDCDPPLPELIDGLKTLNLESSVEEISPLKAQRQVLILKSLHYRSL